MIVSIHQMVRKIPFGRFSIREAQEIRGVPTVTALHYDKELGEITTKDGNTTEGSDRPENRLQR